MTVAQEEFSNYFLPITEKGITYYSLAEGIKGFYPGNTPFPIRGVLGLSALHYAATAFEGMVAYQSILHPETINLVDPMGRIDRLFTSTDYLRFHGPHTEDYPAHLFHPDLVKTVATDGERVTGQEAEHYVETLPGKTFPLTKKEVFDIIKDTVLLNTLTGGLTFDRKNPVTDVKYYIRPVSFRGLGGWGVGTAKNDVSLAIGTAPWGDYLGEKAKTGVDLLVLQHPDNSDEYHHKLGTNYAKGQRIKNIAVGLGYNDAIRVYGSESDPMVGEGSGMNVFVAKKNNSQLQIVTPPVEDNPVILPGRTRHWAIHFLRERGYDVHEEHIPMYALMKDDVEGMALTGTAAEITPVRSLKFAVNGTNKVFPEIPQPFQELREAYLATVRDNKVATVDLEDLVEAQKEKLLVPLSFTPEKTEYLVEQLADISRQSIQMGATVTDMHAEQMKEILNIMKRGGFA